MSGTDVHEHGLTQLEGPLIVEATARLPPCIPRAPPPRQGASHRAVIQLDVVDLAWPHQPLAGEGGGKRIQLAGQCRQRLGKHDLHRAPHSMHRVGVQEGRGRGEGVLEYFMHAVHHPGYAVPFER